LLQIRAIEICRRSTVEHLSWLLWLGE
jgi:hypothetical protein